MKIVGVICEYNPFHNGHKKQFSLIRKQFGQDTAIVCLMSGNYVQRGVPAIFDKSFRAQAAINSGANLVLELPITSAVSSAEGFAKAGTEILSHCCDTLCFGTESMDVEALQRTARALLDPAFSDTLRQCITSGCSFPAARAKALEKSGILEEGMNLPNNILGIEYAKSILKDGLNMEIFPIHRHGNYHDLSINPVEPSATSIRNAIFSEDSWQAAVPCPDVFQNASRHSLLAGEKAIIGKLRIMSDDEFQALPYGSEGLWRKLMHASRSESTLEEIIGATKSKRYTRTRINRMILCAFLELTASDLDRAVPYIRILGFDDIGRSILHHNHFVYTNVGQPVDDPYWKIEQRCGSLYGLFSTDKIEAPDSEQRRRVYYRRGTHR